MINHDPLENKMEINLFFNKIKIIQINTIPEMNLIIMHKIIFHQTLKKTLIKIISDFIPAKNLVLTVLTIQMFSNHTHKANKYDNLEIIQHLTTKFFNNKTQLTHNQTNQLKCITKFRCYKFYNNMK